MLWQDTKKNNPSAWSKLVEYNEGDADFAASSIRWNLRLLYNFFDENNIIIELMWGLPGFTPNIWCGADISHLERQDTREKAEEVAFTYAFEIMEAELLGYHESTITTVDLKVADETIIKTGKKI